MIKQRAMQPARNLTIPNRSRIVSVAAMQALERAADAGGHSFAAMMVSAGPVSYTHLTLPTSDLV